MKGRRESRRGRGEEDKVKGRRERRRGRGWRGNG